MGFREEAAQVAEVDDDLIRENGVERPVVLVVPPMALDHTYVRLLAGDALLGEGLLRRRERQAYAFDSIGLTEIGQGATPARADIQDALAGFQPQHLRE